MSKYAELLLDPRWQKKRLLVLDRDKWTCQLCGAVDKTLHVHHAAYDPFSGNPWDAQEALLFTACSDCHGDEHQQGKESNYVLLLVLAAVGICSSKDKDLFTNTVVDLAKGRGAEYLNELTTEDRASVIAEAVRDFQLRKSEQIAGGTWYEEKQ